MLVPRRSGIVLEGSPARNDGMQSAHPRIWRPWLWVAMVKIRQSLTCAMCSLKIHDKTRTLSLWPNDQKNVYYCM